MGNTGEVRERRGGVNYLNTVLIYENLKNKLNVEIINHYYFLMYAILYF